VTDSLEALALVNEFANRSQGILVLIAPTVRTALAALAGAAGSSPSAGNPRVYFVDSRLDELAVLFRELAKEDMAGEVTLYHGSIHEFFRDLPLTPDLLCADDSSFDASAFNPAQLASSLPPDIPVILLNASDLSTVTRGFQDAVASGLLSPPLAKAGGLIFHTTGQCLGSRFVPVLRARLILQGALHERYFRSRPAGPSTHTPVADLTVDIRREFARQSRAAGGPGPWPYFAQEFAELPRTMPSGKPWPKISIVTPAFNQGAYIEETLLSVLHQGYPNAEHIVVDGGSTDDTLSILERYREKLAHVVSEPDNGQSHAINKGMALATGEILTWLNSDDMLAPGALASVALAFDTHDADMIAGICRLYRGGQMVGQHLTSCADGPLPLENLLDLENGWNAGQFFYQPEVMFTRDFWMRAGGYVNDWLHYSMDYELWLRFAEAGARLHVIGRPVAWFRLHEQQKTHVASRFQAELLVCRKDFLTKSGIHYQPAPHPGELRQKLRVTLLNDIGAFYGAGIAHVRMARALAWAGHEVALISILDRSLLGMESTHYTSQDILDRVVETSPDLVIVGNLHAAGADPFVLQLLCERFPTAVVMHDFYMVTGRCAYPAGCEKYITGCDHTCPTPNEYPALPPDQIADAWSKKRLLLGEPQGPWVLTNSLWAAGIASRAFAADAHHHPRIPPVAPFHLSFPLDVFRPRDKRMCREAFDLPADSFIILLAGAISDPRKGGLAFLEALGRLELPNLLVVTLGQPDPTLGFPVAVRQLGQINGQSKVAMVNSAADLVVAPSTEETFGQTVIEAIACGTPALGYPVSGIREAIRDGVTGLLASEADPDGLAAVVQYLYARPEARRNLARWGRLYVENEWSEFAASRHLYLALRAMDSEGRLKLRRNLRFLPSEPEIPPFQTVARCRDGWRPRHGFSPMEFAVPEHGLKPYHWAYGPTALAELFAEDAGLHRVLIAYRNAHKGQRLQLRCNGSECGTFDLSNTGFGSGRMLVANVHLEKGSNLLQIAFSHWDLHREDGRLQAMIVTDILVEPVALCDLLARQTSAEQMLATVWGKETE
jgi:glycosyltransferase involved in cell wall biosynthesis